VRIIAGTHGGRLLEGPRGVATRPTADRVREAIFNILAAGGAAPQQALDLYAGSGAFGLEALSRGAEAAVFVDESAAAATLIRKNACALGVEALCEVATARVVDWLRRAPSAQLFGWIFLDPPYAVAARELDRALALVDERGLLAKGGVAIAEHDHKQPPAERHGTLALSDRRRYGQTAVSFFTHEAHDG
jgi:16S rRNA (guanine966-N2)-methyltransferase